MLRSSTWYRLRESYGEKLIKQAQKRKKTMIIIFINNYWPSNNFELIKLWQIINVIVTKWSTENVKNFNIAKFILIFSFQEVYFKFDFLFKIK